MKDNNIVLKENECAVVFSMNGKDTEAHLYLRASEDDDDREKTADENHIVASAVAIRVNNEVDFIEEQMEWMDAKLKKYGICDADKDKC